MNEKTPQLGLGWPLTNRQQTAAPCPIEKPSIRALSRGLKADSNHSRLEFVRRVLVS